MGFGVVPDTLEEFERQFGRQRIATAAAECGILSMSPQRQLSEDDRKRLFNYLIAGETTAPANQIAAKTSPPVASRSPSSDAAAAPRQQTASSSVDELQVIRHRLRLLTEQHSRLQIEIEQRAKILALEIGKSLSLAAEKRAQVAAAEAQQARDKLKRMEHERHRAVARAELEAEQAEHRASEAAAALSNLEAAHAALLLDRGRLQSELRAVNEPTAERRQLLDQISSLHEQLDKSRRRTQQMRESLSEAEESVVVAETRARTESRRSAALERELTNARQRIEELESEQRPTAGVHDPQTTWFSSTRILKWTSARRGRTRFRVPTPIVVSGSGPLDAETLAAILRSHGAEIASAGESSASTMILGRNEWFVDDIEDQIRARSGQDLYIFSQEMFLTALMVGADPFETADKRTLLDFAESHDGLRFCVEEGFLWPMIPTARVAKRLVAPPEQVGESPLHKMGYQVGRYQGVADRERRGILERAFRGKIPFVESKQYMDHWGLPGSRRRLRRMATLINWHIGGARGRGSKLGHDMSVAIRDWSSDMQWMQSELYEPWMHFRWPGTRVDASAVPAGARSGKKSSKTVRTIRRTATSTPNYRRVLRMK